MRKIIFSLFMLIAFAVTALAQQKDNYEVLRFNAPDITIKGQKIKSGMVFTSDDAIVWGKNKRQVQIIDCKSKSTGLPRRFSNYQFDANKAKTVAEFYLRINKASTRETGYDIVPFESSPEAKSFGERRIALVIGNSEYNKQPYLRNAASDAAMVQAKLLSLGFDVMYGYDCTYERMRTLLNNFSDRAKDYDAAVIYYSGHGLQNKEQNYMVPIECPLEYESNLNQCVGALDFVEKLEETGCTTKIVFFDACRNVQTSWRRSATRGLASMEGTPGMVIVFSTQKGNIALDGEGENSPFTEALLDNIDSKAGFPDMMNNVVTQTYNVTNKAQYPVTTGNLISGFRFNEHGGELPKIKESAPRAKPLETMFAAEKQTQKPATVLDKVTGAIQTPAQTPAKPRAKISFDAPDIDVRLTNVKRTGNNVVITLLLTNNSQKLLKPYYMDDAEPCGGYDNYQTVAYDTQGTAYKPKNGGFAATIAGANAIFNPHFNLPVGVPIKMEITILRLPANTEMLPLVQVAFRNFGTPGSSYGQALLSIRDVYFNDFSNGLSNAEPSMSSYTNTEKPKTSISFDTPDVDVRLTNVKRAGNNIVLSLLLTNNSSKPLKPYYLYNWVNSEDLSNYRTVAYDTQGTEYTPENGGFATTIAGADAMFTTNRHFNLPVGVPIKIEITILKLPANTEMLPLVQMAFSGFGTPGTSLGQALLSIRNIACI